MTAAIEAAKPGGGAVGKPAAIARRPATKPAMWVGTYFGSPGGKSWWKSCWKSRHSLNADGLLLLSLFGWAKLASEQAMSS